MLIVEAEFRAKGGCFVSGRQPLHVVSAVERGPEMRAVESRGSSEPQMPSLLGLLPFFRQSFFLFGILKTVRNLFIYELQNTE